MGGEVEEEVKWVKHYSSNQRILLVGEGDFSFSSCLARFFRSATNIVATSLDTYDVLVGKYKNAKQNLQMLLKLGACTLHGVDATQMRFHPYLNKQKFDRIIFNFPHAGFHGKEDDKRLIERHKKLVHGFLKNASGMLQVEGEIHVSHKTTYPFNQWNITELGWRNCLSLVERVVFKKEEYPGYENKRGDSKRCDEPFPLGQCSTFKFKFVPAMSNVDVNSRIISELCDGYSFQTNYYELNGLSQNTGEALGVANLCQYHQDVPNYGQYSGGTQHATPSDGGVAFGFPAALVKRLGLGSFFGWKIEDFVYILRGGATINFVAGSSIISASILVGYILLANNYIYMV